MYINITNESMKITQENVKLNNRLTNVALYKYGNSIEEHRRVERRINTNTKGITEFRSATNVYIF